MTPPVRPALTTPLRITPDQLDDLLVAQRVRAVRRRRVLRKLARR